MKIHLCKVCGQTDVEKFRDRYNGICKDCQSIYSKQYRTANAEALRIKRKQYRDSNPEVIKERSRQYKLDNAEVVKEKNKEYRIHNVERRKQYYQDNKGSLINYAKQSTKKRREVDPGFRYLENLRNRQRKVLKGVMSTTQGLECNSKELVEYIEAQFQEGMTIANYGEWHIDHIVPLSSYERDIEGGWCKESIYNKKLIHYTNLQPLWAEDNYKKGNKKR